MRQQINLYLEEFRVVRDSLTAILMGQILAGILIFMVLLTSYDLFTKWRLNNQLESLQATLQEETRRTDQLDEQLARRSQNTELSERLERAEANLLASEQIRDFLSQTQLGNVTGFSEFFKDLSRASFDGISLSSISFSEGGNNVQLNGQTTDSAMVPRYVDNIERGVSPLRNQRFSPMISRDAVTDRLFQFELSTYSE